jgi:type I restriction enzyme M protein
MVALPGQLFTNTQIPACIWFLTKNKKARTNDLGEQLRDRTGEVLFIDARNLGYMKDRVLRDFKPEDTKQITDTFHNWQSGENFEDEAGYCKSVKLAEIEKHDFVLTPGRYVGAAEQEDDGEAFVDKMVRLTDQLKNQFEQSYKLEQQIKENLKGLGYEC